MSEFKKRDGGGDDKMMKKPRRPLKRKVCQFCVDKQDHIDYKNLVILKKYITEKGKIVPRRTSGVCAKHQRPLAEAVKKSRQMALLPFVNE